MTREQIVFLLYIIVGSLFPFVPNFSVQAEQKLATVEVYGTIKCEKCRAIYEALSRDDIPVRWHDIEKDTDARRSYLRDFGDGELPLVRYRRQMWRGAQLAEIRKHLIGREELFPEQQPLADTLAYAELSRDSLDRVSEPPVYLEPTTREDSALPAASHLEAFDSLDPGTLILIMLVFVVLTTLLLFTFVAKGIVIFYNSWGDLLLSSFPLGVILLGATLYSYGRTEFGEVGAQMLSLSFVLSAITAVLVLLLACLQNRGIVKGVLVTPFKLFFGVFSILFALTSFCALLSGKTSSAKRRASSFQLTLITDLSAFLINGTRVREQKITHGEL